MPLMREDGEILMEPGDILMIQHMLIGGNATQTDLAVHQIKQTLANDARFNYQGSEIVKEVYSDNSELELLNIYVQVRKTPREQKQESQGGTMPQEANVLAGIAVAVGTLLAIIYAAKIAQNGTVVYRLWVLNGIIRSDMSPADKRAAIAAANKTKPVSTGEAIKAAGEGIGMAAIAALVLAGLWLFSQRKVKSIA